MTDKEIRCHPVIILSELLRAVVLIVLGLASFLGEAFEELPPLGRIWVLLAALAILIIGGIYALFRYLSWKRTFISLTEDSIIYNKKTKIFKKTVRVRISQIATVNLEKTLLDRIFGTYTLKLDINSSKTAEKTDFHLVFSEKTARQIANKVMETKNRKEQGQQSKADAGEVQRSEPILRLSVGNIIAHSLLSVSVLFLIVLGACFGGLFIPFVKTGKYVSLLIPILGLPVAVVSVFLFKVLGAVFYYYDFTVYKTGDEITLSFGLITRRVLRLPLSKTNGVIIRQTFLSRIFGKYYGEIVNVGSVEGDKGVAPKLFLMTGRKNLELLINKLVPDFALDFRLSKSPGRAIIPTFVKGLIPCLVAAVALAVIFPFIGLSPVELYIIYGITAFLLILATMLSFTSKGLGVKDDRLVIASGIFGRRIIITPFTKVQTVRVKKSPISKALGLRRGSVNILSASLNRVNKIGYFPPEEFSKIIKKTEDYL